MTRDDCSVEASRRHVQLAVHVVVVHDSLTLHEMSLSDVSVEGWAEPAACWTRWM